jgi:hypothetical protein
MDERTQGMSQVSTMDVAQTISRVPTRAKTPCEVPCTWS